MPRFGNNLTNVTFLFLLVKMSTYDENESKFLRKAKENPFVPVGRFLCPIDHNTKKEIEDDLLEIKDLYVVIEMFCLNVGFKCTPLSTLYVVKVITLTHC